MKIHYCPKARPRWDSTDSYSCLCGFVLTCATCGHLRNDGYHLITRIARGRSYLGKCLFAAGYLENPAVTYVTRPIWATPK